MSNIFFYEPFYDFDRFFEHVFNPRTAGWNQSPNNRRLEQQGSSDGAIRLFKPRMDLHENSEKNIVTATFELPGIKKEDVQLDTHNGRLTVSAEAKLSADHDENGYAVRERRFGKFSRTLQLPRGVKDEDIKAGMEDGVLTIVFPKASSEQAPTKITIN